MSDAFAEALTHHRAGRVEQAAQIYRALLAADPQNADCLNLLGVIAHQQGDDVQAVELLQRAIQLNPQWPSYYVNLATALRGLQRHEEAVRCCQAVLEIDPDLFEARLALGLSLQALRYWPEAENQFRWLTERQIVDSRGPQALGNCLREQGRDAEAAENYVRALERNPNDAAAHLGLGTVLLTDKNPGAAEPHLRRATQMLPGIVAAWMNYGTCLVKLGREKEAVPVFQYALQLDPNDPRLGVNLGQAWLGTGDLRAAENCFNAVLSFHTDFPAALIGLADVYSKEERLDEAIRLYERARQLEPTGDAYKGLVDALWDSEDVERAVALLREGIAGHPHDAENHVRLASMLAAGGDLDGAVASCRAALAIRPGHPLALAELAQTSRAKLPDSDRVQLEEALRQPVAAAVRSALHFGLAQVADARDDYANAAKQLQLANVLAKGHFEAKNEGFKPEQMIRYVDRMIEIVTPEFLARSKDYGVPDERPVFVVGVPRSGTTLVEQILASHPQVFGAGERRFADQSLLRLAKELGRPAEPLECLDRLTPELARACAGWHLEQLRRLDEGRSARVVDKMPENFTFLGWLALQFPKARFIHCRRDVRDVALSCWMTNFSRIRWANDLEHIAVRVRSHQRLMDHWRKVLPVPLLEVDYERLVADQEGESRKIVAWLGLNWDPACLTFYQSNRLIRTPSVTQVRQPMYSRSVGRWKNYQESLKPFLKAMNMD